MKTFVSGRPYWWQWFTILSLDATAVGLAWQMAFARTAGTALRPSHQAVLGSSIWCAYTADRWIEGWRLSPSRTMTQRHHFSVRWRWPLACVWAAIFAADLFCASDLTSREFSCGLLLLIPVTLYLLSHQFLHRDHPWRLPKEVCVALLMVGGAIVFVVSQPGLAWRSMVPLALGFTLLCFTNCALISAWEREVDETQGQESLARRSRRLVRAIHVLPWLVAIAAAIALCVCPANTRPGMLCVCLSALLLGGLDLLEPRTGRQLARVLVDGVLLTPLIFFFWPRS